MKLPILLPLFLLPLLMTAPAKEEPAKSNKNPIQARSWVGGEFKKAAVGWPGEDLVPAFPKALRGQQKSAVFVSAVYPDTPLADAGIRPGDLITKVDGKLVKSRRQFHQAIDVITPGDRTTLTLFRQGKQIDKVVTTGREEYRTRNSLNLGIQFSSKLDLIPNPGFSLFDLITLKTPKDDRLQLNHPEQNYLRETWAANGNPIRVSRTKENWAVWLLVAGVSGNTEIIRQQRIAK